MSRVHDALRRAQQDAPAPPADRRPARAEALVAQNLPPVPPQAALAAALPSVTYDSTAYERFNEAERQLDIGSDFLQRLETVPFTPSADASLIDMTRPQEAPTEEFRTLRTRLNHLQSLQRLHSLVISSPSPAEGKSFAAVNLAMAEAHLEDNPTLLCDFDLRRPVVHTVFQLPRSPGLTDFLMGNAELHEIIKRIEGTNLYVAPAGTQVLNPLELLNRAEVRTMLQELPRVFNWVILDSPPLLFAADASLLSTLSDGAILVVRIGTTTIDSVTRAMQSLCNNNVIGTVVNGARRGELYSKYTYYHSYYYNEGDKKAAPEPEPEPEA